MTRTALLLGVCLVVSFLVFARPNPPAGKSAKPASTSISSPKNPTSQGLANGYGALPLSFEPNEGQANSAVRYLARGAGYTVLLTDKEAVLSLQGQEGPDDESERLIRKMDARTQKRFQTRKFYRLSPRFHLAKKHDAVRIVMNGANPSAEIQPFDQLPGKANYFIGNDPEKWRTGIPTSMIGLCQEGKISPGALGRSAGAVSLNILSSPVCLSAAVPI